MRTTKKTLTAIAVCILPLAVSLAQQLPRVRVDFKETTLRNGLRVITVEDHTAPVISLVITYNVGGANERKGRTEFAHFFEHMMFQGTQNVRAGEYDKLVFGTGGVMDATVNDDRTLYFETVPANQLELPLFLESDRLRGLSVTQAKVDNERNVVQEERRMRVLNQPYGRSAEALQELLYDNFAYKHGGMESMEDLNAATLEDIKDFFNIYYAPNNAVLALVGDFNTAKAIDRVKKYFEDIPRRPDPPAVDLSEPEQKAERRRTLEDALARLPQVSIAFKAAPSNTPDFYALQILSAAFQRGQSSRLYQKLVKETELVSDLGGYVSETRGPGALYITATPNPGKKAQDVEAEIFEEIERLKREPLTDAEIEKAKNSTTLEFVSRLQRSLLRALFVGQFAVFYNDPDLINTRLDRIAAVRQEDIKRVLTKYLRPTNRTVVVTLPKSSSKSNQ